MAGETLIAASLATCAGRVGQRTTVVDPDLATSPGGRRNCSRSTGLLADDPP